MASEDPSSHLAESGITMHSDSEQYSPGEELSTSPASSGSPVILYKPPTPWSLIRGVAINLLLPFINGMMLGFGELFAHEAAFRLGWGGTKVRLVSCLVYSSSQRRFDHAASPWLWKLATPQCQYLKAPHTNSMSQVFPMSRRRAHPIGPGIEVRERRETPRPSLEDLASLE